MPAPRGNKFAARAKRWRSALERALATEAGSIDKGLDKLAIARVKQAFAGHEEAIREIGDRLDGKPAQSLDITGEMTHRNLVQLSDDELLEIASGKRDSEAQVREDEPSELH